MKKVRKFENNPTIWARVEDSYTIFDNEEHANGKQIGLSIIDTDGENEVQFAIDEATFEALLMTMRQIRKKLLR